MQTITGLFAEYIERDQAIVDALLQEESGS
jgi:hypothetical protein